MSTCYRNAQVGQFVSEFLKSKYGQIKTYSTSPLKTIITFKTKTSYIGCEIFCNPFDLFLFIVENPKSLDDMTVLFICTAPKLEYTTAFIDSLDKISQNLATINATSEYIEMNMRGQVTGIRIITKEPEEILYKLFSEKLSASVKLNKVNLCESIVNQESNILLECENMNIDYGILYGFNKSLVELVVINCIIILPQLVPLPNLINLEIMCEETLENENSIENLRKSWKVDSDSI